MNEFLMVGWPIACPWSIVYQFITCVHILANIRVLKFSIRFMKKVYGEMQKVCLGPKATKEYDKTFRESKVRLV